MQRIFDSANLDELQLLDLSYNYFRSLPYDLPCAFRSLTHLDLRQNMLETMNINVTCLQRIETIDLSRNHFHTLSMEFRRTIANQLPDYSLVMRNSFYCDCTSHAYISWLRSNAKIRDKDALTCARASPVEFVNARLVDVPIELLDCTVSMTTNVAANCPLIVDRLSIMIAFVMSALVGRLLSI